MTKFFVYDKGNILILKNERGKMENKMRLKKYDDSRNVFISVTNYDGKTPVETCISINEELRMKLKEWL